MHRSLISKREGASLPGPEFLGLARAVLGRGASFRFRASGGSMAPFIREGDLLTIRPLADNAPHLGDIVAFIHPDRERLTVHRIIGRRNGACLLRGDNASRPDGWVPWTKVLGRLETADRRGRRVRIGFGYDRLAFAVLLRLGLLRTILAPVRLAARLQRETA